MHHGTISIFIRYTNEEKKLSRNYQETKRNNTFEHSLFLLFEISTGNFVARIMHKR